MVHLALAICEYPDDERYETQLEEERRSGNPSQVVDGVGEKHFRLVTEQRRPDEVLRPVPQLSKGDQQVDRARERSHNADASENVEPNRKSTLLINGRLPENPQTFDVTEGERIRFRFVNAESATVFGAGERYDAVIEATNPGRWFVQADALDGNEPPATAVVEYESASGESPQRPSSASNQLQYGDLRVITSLDGVSGDPDRTFDLTLSRGRGQSYTWTIDGQAYPDADPLQIRPGEHVRIRMTN